MNKTFLFQNCVKLSSLEGNQAAAFGSMSRSKRRWLLAGAGARPHRVWEGKCHFRIHHLAGTDDFEWGFRVVDSDAV
jgi:hypothetical protein